MGQVALFTTCFNEIFFPNTLRAMVAILERLGEEPVFAEEQTCCGQMHANSGYASDALSLLRRFTDIFGPYERIVSPSASCVGMVREGYRRLAEKTGDGALVRQVEALVPRVFELSEFLVDELQVEDVGASFHERVAYHPTCHSLRGLDLGDRPLRLLNAVDGLELVDLPAATECCGFGGTFAVKNAPVSNAMLYDKLSSIVSSGATVLAAVDNSCLMHIGGGARNQRVAVRTLHLAEILASR